MSVLFIINKITPYGRNLCPHIYKISSLIIPTIEEIVVEHLRYIMYPNDDGDGEKITRGIIEQLIG